MECHIRILKGNDFRVSHVCKKAVRRLLCVVIRSHQCPPIAIICVAFFICESNMSVFVVSLSLGVVCFPKWPLRFPGGKEGVSLERMRFLYCHIYWGLNPFDISSFVFLSFVGRKPTAIVFHLSAGAVHRVQWEGILGYPGSLWYGRGCVSEVPWATGVDHWAYIRRAERVHPVSIYSFYFIFFYVWLFSTVPGVYPLSRRADYPHLERVQVSFLWPMTVKSSWRHYLAKKHKLFARCAVHVRFFFTVISSACLPSACPSIEVYTWQHLTKNLARTGIHV